MEQPAIFLFRLRKHFRWKKKSNEWLYSINPTQMEKILSHQQFSDFGLFSIPSVFFLFLSMSLLGLSQEWNIKLLTKRIGFFPWLIEAIHSLLQLGDNIYSVLEIVLTNYFHSTLIKKKVAFHQIYWFCDWLLIR